MLYELTKNPNARELNEIIDHHTDNYLDYCRVWFKDGTTAIYYNTMPIQYCKSPNKYYVDFRNPILYGNGMFGVLGIIRSKRICKKILDK
jgi:hypothetical protein